MSEEELNFAVQRLADSDGEISFDAFTEFWSSDDKFKSLHLDGDQLEHVHRASTYFQYFDEDGNGTLSKDEFYKLYEDLSNYGLLLPSVEDCFDELDADKSGSITFNEYIQWLIKTQAINVGTAV